MGPQNMERKHAWEVDSEGNIIEFYSWTDEEIQQAKDEGKRIVEKEWKIFHHPKFDFELNDWVEGKPQKEVLELDKAFKINNLKRQCELSIYEPFQASNGHLYDFEIKDQMNFSQMFSLLLADKTIEDVQWKTVDAGVLLHTREEFLQVCKDAEHHKRGNMSKYWQLKGLVEAAKEPKDIKNIDWNLQ